MFRAVKEFGRKVKQGPSDREQRESEQLQIVQDLTAELQDQYRPYKGKQKTDNDRTQYLTSRRIQQRVLTRDRLRSLFKGRYDWFTDSGLDLLYAKYTCIIATLITIKWVDWKDFGTIFLDHRDKKKNPTRCDDQLPFDANALDFLKVEAFRRAFFSDQYIYCPVMFVQDENQKFSENQRLPFVEPLKFIDEGSFGRIRGAVIDDHQLKYTRDFKATGPLIANVRTKLALKEITKRESWERECSIQESLKQCSTRHHSLQLSFSSFERGQQLGILYPLADLNLAKFLQGQYPDCSRRASLFKPHHVFQQMSLLAEAFHWMHEFLSLDGDESKCYHLDFKASNVLVFWDSKNLAGEWKIIDFGLGHFSPHRARPDHHRLSALLEPSDASSYIAGTRPPGPHSAPEMHIGAQVSGSADRYSYGTVYAEVLAFYIGGPNLVRELTLERSTDHDGCFWSKDSENNPILKPSVDRWLGRLTSGPGAHQPFIVNAVQYIRRLLAPNRDQRMKSFEMEATAKTLAQSTKNLNFSWEMPVSNANGPVDGSPVLPRPNSGSTVASHMSQIDVVPTRPKRRFLEIFKFMKKTRQTQIARDEGSTGREMAPIIALSSTSLWPAPPKVMQYRHVRSPPGTIQARIGANLLFASFCSPKIVFLYDIQALYGDNAYWNASPEVSAQPPQSVLPVRVFDAPQSQMWKSVLMEGNFIALWSHSQSASGLNMVTVYEYALSSEGFLDQLKDLKYEFALGKNCLDVQLSSRGHLALVYKDYIELRHRNGKLLPEGRAASIIKKAAFSKDGDTLCVWRHDVDSHLYYWHFSTVFDDHLDEYKHWEWCPKSPRRQDEFTLGVHDQDVILVAIQNATAFLSCDETGQMMYLGTSEREMLEQRNDPCEGAYMALPCAEGSVALLQRCEEETLSTVSIAISRLRAGNQHVDLMTRWATVGRSAHGSDCGAVTFSEGSRIGMMASFHDGTIVRL